MEGLGAHESLNDGYSAVLDILSHILFMALPLCSILKKKILGVEAYLYCFVCSSSYIQLRSAGWSTILEATQHLAPTLNLQK